MFDGKYFSQLTSMVRFTRRDEEATRLYVGVVEDGHRLLPGGRGLDDCQSPLELGGDGRTVGLVMWRTQAGADKVGTEVRPQECVHRQDFNIENHEETIDAEEE